MLENRFMRVFDPANSWEGQTLEHLAFRVMREHYQHVCGDEIYVFISAAKRVYIERQVQR